MALVDRDTAMLDLSPYLLSAPNVFRAAWLRTNACGDLDKIDRSKTTCANLMRDYAVADLQRLWNADNDVHFCETAQQSLFLIKSMYAVRIKKLDRASCSSNYRTSQDLNFRAQGEIPDVGAVHNLELGYVLDSAEVQIQDVRIVCLNGDRPYWWQSIESPADNIYDLFQGECDPNTPKPQIAPSDLGVIIKPKGEYEA